MRIRQCGRVFAFPITIKINNIKIDILYFEHNPLLYIKYKVMVDPRSNADKNDERLRGDLLIYHS